MVKPTRELVIAKIEEIYRNRDVSEILAILDRYGDEEYEKEKNRVQLAALKLSDEQGLPDPSRYIIAAKQDYRDVLAWAEYPHQMKTDFLGASDPNKFKRLKQLDEEQYRKWLVLKGK